MHPIRKEIRNLDRSRKALRSFGVVVGSVLLVAAGGVFFFGGSIPIAASLAAAGGALVGLGLVAPRALRPVHLVWMAFALVLGYVMTRVLLTAVFYLLITPIALLMRLFGRDPMRRGLEPDAPSYWIPRKDTVSAKERMERYY